MSVSPGVRKICWDRDRGTCVRCLKHLTGDQELQHRKARGMGGTKAEWINQAANLIYLCRECHRYIESRERAYGEVFGWVILGREKPHEVELFYQGRWARLDDEGRVHYLPRLS